jgi:hypothetical protein
MFVSRSQTFARSEQGRTAKDGPILAVGRRVVVASASSGPRHVTLTHEDGTTVLTTLAPGVEVEILAWRPARSGGTRYRVVPTQGGVEGWLGAANLRPHLIPPPPPKPAARAATQVASAKTVKRVARGGATRAMNARR